MRLKDIIQPYIDKEAVWKAEGAKLQSSIDKRTQQLERLKKGEAKHWLNSPRWIDLIINPIGEALLPYLPGYDRFEILGPFGICCEVSIFFIKQGTIEAETPHANCHCYECIEAMLDRAEYMKGIASITFVSGDLSRGELYWLDYSKNSGEYASGTIGEMNGLNYSNIPIDPEADITELISILKRK